MGYFDDDRIKETTTTAGLLDFVLAGHVRTFFPFSSVYADLDTFDYVAIHSQADEVEIGGGVYHAGTNTVERATIYRSSTANAKVNFSSGTKYIFVAIRKGRFDGTVPCVGGAVTAPGPVTGSNLSGTNTGDQTNVSGSSGSCTGNAATATLLQTARTINGVSFNGSGNITVTAAAGTLTGTTLNASVVSSSLTSVGTLAALTVAGNVSLTGGSMSLASGAATALTVTAHASSTWSSSAGTLTIDAPTLQIGDSTSDIEIGKTDFTTPNVGIQGVVVQVITPHFSVNSSFVFLGDGGSTASILLQGDVTIGSGGNASQTITFSVTGTDPVLTASAGVLYLTGSFGVGVAPSYPMHVGKNQNASTYSVVENTTNAASSRAAFAAIADGSNFVIFGQESTTYNGRAFISTNAGPLSVQYQGTEVASFSITGTFTVAQQAGNPAGVAGHAGIFAKAVAGTTKLFAVDGAGTVTQLTP